MRDALGEHASNDANLKAKKGGGTGPLLRDGFAADASAVRSRGGPAGTVVLRHDSKRIGPSMPTPRRTPSAERALAETPEGRLLEQDLKRLIGYQVAQASIATLAVFDETVGKPLGLRTVEYTVLALVEANQEVSPAHLAKGLNLSPSYITLALDKLEGQGLITRETNQRDRRGQRLGTTAKGRSLVARMTRDLIEAERQAYSTLTDVERLMLAELLHKLARSRRHS